MKASPEKLAQIAAWQKANPGRVRSHKRKWAEANRERARKRNRLRMRERRAADPVRERAISRRSHLKNIDRRRADARARVPKWRKENPEAYALQGEVRRTRKAVGRGVAKGEWITRLEEFNGRCGYCGRVRKLSMDHMDPLSKGGAHEIENAAPACKSCNSRKHDRSILHWLIADRRAAA